MSNLMTLMHTNRQPNGSTVHIRAVDVTGNFSIEDEVETGASASSVATSFARRMGLPLDAPYTLRTEAGKWLLDEKPIGPQVRGQEDQKYTLTPKSHLG